MWQQELVQVVAEGRHSTQAQLVGALSRLGYEVNQSSISRELKTRGIHKVGGRYVLPIAAGLPESVELLEARTTSVGPLVVLRTHPAGASLLAQAVDFARIPGVIGTIAGDDTVFVACSGHATLTALGGFLGRHLQFDAPEGGPA